MSDKLDEIRLENGELPAYAWPGGYPIYYIDRDNCVVCPDCANKEPLNGSYEIVAYDINWEDSQLYCDDCGGRIESAYAEENND